MTDYGPNYSRRIVGRRMAVTLAAGFGFVVTGCAVSVWVANLLDDRTDIEPNLLAAGTMWSGILSGVIAGVLCGWAAGRVHRSLWPESPDEG